MDFRDELLSYGIVLGRRFSEKEKKKFLYAAQIKFEQLKYKTNILKSNLNTGTSRKGTHYNLYTSNIKNANVVVATYYDTGLKNTLNSNVYAFSKSDSEKNRSMHLVLSLIILAVLSGLGYFYFVPKMQIKGFVSVWGLFLTIYMLVSFYIMNKISSGFPNKYNFIKNTSSILGVFKLLEINKSNDVAYALIDGGTSTNYGFKMLQSSIKKDATIIYLDALANGEKMVIYKQKELISNDLDNFSAKDDSALFVTFGKMNEGKVIIKNGNTSKDNEIDEKLLNKNVEKINSLISRTLM